MSMPTPKDIAYEMAHATDNRQSSMLVIYSVSLVVAVIAVVLRFVARRVSRNVIRADDWMMVAGLSLATAEAVMGIYAVKLGAGKHDIFARNSGQFAKVMLSIEILYTSAAALIKFSTLLLYYRIFNSSRRFMWACWAVAALIAAYSSNSIGMSLLQCIPLHKVWQPETPGKCLPTYPAATIPASLNVVADFATVFLPIPLVWALQMQWRRKLQIVGIFLLGGFVIIASIFRAITQKNLSHIDATWSNIDPCLWSMAENAVAIVSTCLLTMRPLYSLIKRGHYCRVNEHCTRCREATSRATTSQGSRSWPQRLGGRKGITHLDSFSAGSSSTSPVSAERRGDIEQQWEGGEKTDPEVKIDCVDTLSEK